MKKITVENHKQCVELVSGKFRIAVTTQVGPRVIGGWIGKSENIFRVMPNKPIPGVGTNFRLYGGHRLWHAPEVKPRTYAEDNAPVLVRETGDGVEFNSGVEELNGIEKSITIEPLGQERFRLVHRITNRGQWGVELAPWALSVMNRGGMAVIPQNRNPEGNPFAPDRFLVAWAYTSLNDPRLSLGRDFIFLRHDGAATGPCKVGLNAEAGWIAYVNNGTALVKHFEHFADAEYPDNGCSVESYSCADFCEIETLGPLYDLQPGGTAEHVEIWHGLGGLPAIKTEADATKKLLPKIKAK